LYSCIEYTSHNGNLKGMQRAMRLFAEDLVGDGLEGS